MNYVDSLHIRDCEPLTQDEVERMRRDHNRAVTLDFAAIPDPPSGHYFAHEELLRVATIAVTNAAHPIFSTEAGAVNYVPMIDWERIAAQHARECTVMVRALRMAKAKIARLEAAAPTAPKVDTVSDRIAAVFSRPTVPDAYGR